MVIPNMPIHPQFFNNLYMPQHQQQFGLPNQLLPSLFGNLMGAHSLPPLVHPTFFCQPLGNSFNPLPYSSVPTPHQNHPKHPPGFSVPRPQNKFSKQQKFNGTGQGFQRSQLHQVDHRNKKFGFNRDHTGNGNNKKSSMELDGSDEGNIAKEKKRPYVWKYTPTRDSAMAWNYPTKLNFEKNLKENASDCNLDEEATMRPQQLMEVLEKQAELGVEVTKVPSHYLSNADEQVQYKDGKKGRFQNNNKRRHGGKERFSKNPKFQDNNLSQESSLTTLTRQPTLLEKLLSAETKRDKSQLLQVFRFMVMNSFFKESSEQPLKLALVMVEETGCEHDRDDPTTEVLSDVDVNGDDNSCDEASD